MTKNKTKPVALSMGEKRIKQKTYHIIEIIYRDVEALSFR